MDVTRPVIATTAVSGHKGCNYTVVAPTFTATDGCIGNIALVVNTDGPTSLGCNWQQTWTANATDACGNTAIPVSVTYTWTNDLVRPVISTTAVDSNLGCNPVYIDAPIFTVTDNCATGNLTPVVTVGSVVVNGCNRSQTWTANYTDACGNIANPVRITYTWTVVTAPVFANLPAGGDLGCNPARIPKCDDWTNTVTASNQCGPLGWECIPGPITQMDHYECHFIQTFTFRATSCGLTTEVEVSYWWRQTAPVVVTPVASVTHPSTGAGGQQAVDAAFASWLAGFRVTGGCNPKVVMTPAIPVAPHTCGGSVTVTWVVSDLCYTTTTRTATFTVTPRPVVVTPVANATHTSASFANQQAANTAFANWLTGFGVSGGCNPVVTTSPAQPVAPSVCGGAVSVTWTVTDLNYATTTHTATFTITPVPAVSCSGVIVGPVHVEGAPILLTGATPAGGTYSGAGVAGNFFNPSVAGVGTHTITYTHTHPNGCTSSCTFNITVYRPSVAIDKTANRATFAAIGDQITYTVRVTNNGTIALTSVIVKDPLINLNQTIPTLAPGASQTFTGTYTIKYSDMVAQKVVNTATVEATFLHGKLNAEDGVMVILSIAGNGIIVSDGFSPNGDSMTDDWQILGLDNHPNHGIKVFNRNGALVWESEGTYTPWTGVANRGHIVSGRGGIVPAGVYFYVISLEPGGAIVSGAVHVLY